MNLEEDKIMKKAFNVNNILNAIHLFERDNQFELNCNRNELACCIVDFMNNE